MIALENTLSKAIRDIPECVAAGYVDMATGMLLGVKTVDSHPREVLDLVAAAAADLFQGSNVTAIEKMFKRARGIKDDGHHYFQEMVIFSDNLLHVFIRSKKNQDHVGCFVSRKTANIGMMLTKARLAMPALEATM